MIDYTFFEKILEKAAIKIEAFADLISHLIDIILVAPCYEDEDPIQVSIPCELLFEIVVPEEKNVQKDSQNDWTLI